MKKLLILSMAALFAFPAVNVAASDFGVISSQSSPMLLAQVSFRSLQRLRSSDGREIYFYPGGKCEGFDENGRLYFTTTYDLYSSTKEFRLLDENGNTVYKGTYYYKGDGRNLSSIYLAGTEYRAR